MKNMYFPASLSANRQNQQLEFCVRENGVGMKQDKLNKLFHIEDNVSSPSTQNELGTGLNLVNDRIDTHSCSY